MTIEHAIEEEEPCPDEQDNSLREHFEEHFSSEVPGAAPVSLRLDGVSRGHKPPVKSLSLNMPGFAS